MENLEKYLDQVCRGLGGPMDMRRHVRQELREHLLDAVAQHKAAGLADDAALTLAIQEFGKPEEVRTELEATHGQRMNWFIDKAMQWKEKTMKSKMLWMSWAHGMLGALLALEILFITFNVIWIIPRFQKLMVDGIIDPDIMEDQGVAWFVNFLHNLSYVGGHWTTQITLAAIVLWGLFEWRVKSEHKSFIRLSILGTVAVTLLVVIVFMGMALVISFTLGAPALGRIAQPWVIEQVTTIETSVKQVEKSLAAKNWKYAAEPMEQAHSAATRLTVGPAARALAASNDNAKIMETRAHLKTLPDQLRELQSAIRDEDSKKAEAALQTFRKAFEPVREAAKAAPR